MRGGTTENPSLFENDFNNVVLVRSSENGVEYLLRRTFKDTLSALTGSEAIEGIDNVDEGNSADGKREREEKTSVKEGTAKKARTVLCCSSLPI